jgi:hypothetical protein
MRTLDPRFFPDHARRSEYERAWADGCTVREVMKRLGISRSAVNGMESRLGLRFRREPRRYRAPEPICIRGTLYPSVQAAAEALMLSPSTIYYAKSRGRLDTLGLGQGNHGRHRTPRPARPVLFEGKQYRSIGHAAAMTGVPKWKISRLTSAKRTATPTNSAASATAPAAGTSPSTPPAGTTAAGPAPTATDAAIGD